MYLAEVEKWWVRVRSFVSFEYFHPMNAFEMETIPLIEKEYDKGHHTLMAAPGKIARSCVACGTATRYFCYGCSGDGLQH